MFFLGKYLANLAANGQQSEFNNSSLKTTRQTCKV
jgi:hypothetical protein